MRQATILAIVLLAAGPAGAQSGVPPDRAASTPAAPTANSPPDGGHRYEYPPNTATILPPERRTPYSGQGDPPPRDPGVANPTPGLSSRPPEQIGR